MHITAAGRPESPRPRKAPGKSIRTSTGKHQLLKIPGTKRSGKKNEKPHGTPSTAVPPTVRKRASEQVPLPHRDIQPGIYRLLFPPPREAAIKDAPLRTEKGQTQNQSSRSTAGCLQKIAGRTVPPVCRDKHFPPAHGRTQRHLFRP